MKIKQVTTIDAEHLPGVGTLDKTLLSPGSGGKIKYPNIKMEFVEPGVGVLVTINSKSAIIPWGRIRTAVVSD